MSLQPTRRSERVRRPSLLGAGKRGAREVVLAARARGTDGFIASFPKSGRTWLRFILANYLNRLLSLGLELDLRSMFGLIPNDVLDPEPEPSEPPPEPDIFIDRSIPWTVRRQLHKFLLGKRFNLKVVNEALARVQIIRTADGSTMIAPVEGEAATDSMYALLETHIRSLEENIDRDLPWLYVMVPTRLDDMARKTYLRKLQVVRKRQFISLEDWYAYELKRL